MTFTRIPPFVAAAALVGLAGCDGGSPLGFLTTEPERLDQPSRGIASTSNLVERDVEMPDVFSATEAGLWDGRPSLGGVWVAHPDATDPERVRITNPSTGETVVGALFRRERENPGPKLQVSSEAAEALGLLAGQPAELTVVALRTQQAEEPIISDVSGAISGEVPVAAAAAPDAAIAAEALDATAEITEVSAPAAEPVVQPQSAAQDASLGAPLDATGGANTPGREIDVSNLTAAISAGEAAAAEVQTTELAPAEATAQATEVSQPTTSALDKPFIQVGIFSAEANASSAADRMRSAGMVPVVREGGSGDNAFWRVLVGPSSSAAEQGQILSSIQGAGFADAYPVSN